MKVTVPEHQSKTTLSALLLELQLTNDLAQLSSAISVYQELIAFCLQYAFLFKNEDSAPIGEVFSQKQERLSTPDPARDGTNWIVYCAANPVGRWDPTGLGTLDDFAYQQRTKARQAEEAAARDVSNSKQKAEKAKKLRGSADKAEKSYTENNKGYAKYRVVVVSQIDVNKGINNFLYNLLVHWNCDGIKEAAESNGYVFEPLPGEKGRAKNFGALQQDPTIARIIVIGHGDEKQGALWDEKDEKFIVSNKCIVPVIDMVGCFANTNRNYKSFTNNITGTYTQVNTYNPNGKTIWFWQTNEALGKKIPDSIENRDSNSSGEPGNLLKGLFYSIWY